MVKEINIIRRIGSKQNDIKHFSKFLPLDCKIVVEPFGGSFAVSKWFYKDINKYDFHINDLEYELFYIYTNYTTLINVLKELASTFNEANKKDKVKHFKSYLDSMDINHLIKSYIIKNCITRDYIVSNIPTQNLCKAEYDILDRAKFTNEDYTLVMEKYKDNEDAFLFLDPPYLFNDNSAYIPQNEKTDMTSIIVYINEYLKTAKCKVMLIINKLAILEYIFKDNIKYEYSKVYGISNKKSVHLIITNY